jgi:ribonucleoside-diphosphate reductase alpha chain
MVARTKKEVKRRPADRPYKMQGDIPVDIGDRRLYDTYDSTITDRFQKKLKRIDVTNELSQIPDTTLSLLEKRYLIVDEDGKVVEDPQGLFSRVASNIAYADIAYGASEDKAYQSAKDFYKMMISNDFMPNSPALMNAGRELQQLSACFVLPIDDSMVSILGTQKDAGLVHKSGGGTGFSWSRLRMANDMVTSTYGLSSGPVRFLGAYDRTTEAVNQGGTRRGANMGVMDYNHPDILEFIKLKTEEGKCANFNLSIGLGDEFMMAAQFGDWYTLMNRKKGEMSPVRRGDLEKMMRAVDKEKIKVPEMNFYLNKEGNPVENLAGLSMRFNEKDELQLNAKEVFEYIVDCAWKLGEPGLLFMDTINKANPTPRLGRIEATNPCGEQPLLPYESCNLGSINLANFVLDGQLDEKRLKSTVRKGVRFLDNVIDMSRFSLEEINHMVHQTRKIGLGVMGWADALIKMNVPYDSEKAIELADRVMELIDTTGKEESEKLAGERGVFPTYFGSIYDGKRLMRNASVTTVAPTGSVSKIAGETSGGIEPRFSIITTHTDSDGTERTTVIPTFEIDMRKYGVDGEKLEDIMGQLRGRKGEDKKWIEKPKKLKEIEGVPDEIIEIYKTSNDIPVCKRIDKRF